MQSKDIPDLPILRFLANMPLSSHFGEPASRRWATWFWTRKGDYAPNPEYEFLPDNSVGAVMPEGIPDKLRVAKMRRLIERGLVDGCGCGCRGDYVITQAGLDYIADRTPIELTVRMLRGDEARFRAILAGKGMEVL